MGISPDYRRAKEAIAQFEEHCRLGLLVAADGTVNPPPLLAGWTITIDGEPAGNPPLVPTDNRDHELAFAGPGGVGHMTATVRVRPNLKVVR